MNQESIEMCPHVLCSCSLRGPTSPQSYMLNYVSAFCRRSPGESERREHSGKDVLAGDSPHSEQVRPFGVFH